VFLFLIEFLSTNTGSATKRFRRLVGAERQEVLNEAAGSSGRGFYFFTAK
jgi:hypothetical protein